MNRKIHILFFLLALAVKVSAQSVSQNFNVGSVNSIESDCWDFTSNVDIGVNSPINGGSNKRQVEADFSGFSGNAEFRSPYVDFKGSRTVSFKHKMDSDDNSWVSSNLSLYLRDVNGTYIGPIFTHVYRQFSFFGTPPPTPNGSPTAVNTVNFTVPATYSGYYQVVWYWNGFLNGGDGRMDDVSVTTDTTSYQLTDVVCTGDVNVTYDPPGAATATNFQYKWAFLGTPGGTIATQYTNKRRARVTWTTTPGVYELVAKETYNGNCTGRRFVYTVTVVAKPTVAVSFNPVCEDFAPVAELNFTGVAPFQLQYKVDGGTTQTFTTSSTNTTLNLPVNAASFQMVQINDALAPCNGTGTGTTAVPYYPAPAAGPLYHY